MENMFLRGVNLGGWLLLERWMTPGLFKGTGAIDEHTFMQTPEAKEKIETHRRTFITEEDFRWLANHNVNAVRIPVGYWVLKDDYPYLNAVQHLDWAMDMADKYRIHAIIDIHGLPGSQNGRDHSGRAGRAGWYDDVVYRQRSLEVVCRIAERYRHRASFWGLQVINEPKLGLFNMKLRRYYRQIYAELIKILPPRTSIIISDAFTPRLLSGVIKATTHPVVMDVHLYHMSTLFANRRSIDWFFKKTTRRQKLLKRLSRKQPVIIGEWSGVISHQTMRRVPKDRHSQVFFEYVRLQQATYSTTKGWFYWNYKTEGSNQWNFRSQVETGLIKT